MRGLPSDTTLLRNATREVLQHWRFRSDAGTKQRLVQMTFNYPEIQRGEKAISISFTNAKGVPIQLQTLILAFKAALKRAGLSSPLRLYDLRHSCASILMVEGLNPKIVSERLGHSNIDLTLQPYSRVSKGMQDAASDRLEKGLFGGVGARLARKTLRL